MLSGRTQRRAFPSLPERRNENINVNKYLIFSSGIEPTTSRFTGTLCAPAPRLASPVNQLVIKKFYILYLDYVIPGRLRISN